MTMSSAEHYKQRQEDEVIAISSMYPDDFEDIRVTDPWKVWRPPHISVRVYSSAERDNNCVRAVSVLIEMAKDYPDSVPRVSFAKEVGLSDVDLEQLRNSVVGKARQLVGQEMVMELLLVVTGHLASLSQPVFRSLHEEAAYHARRAEAHTEQQLHRQLEQQRAALEQRRSEVLHAQESRRRELRKHKLSQRRDSQSASDSGLASRDQSAAVQPVRVPPMTSSLVLVFEARGQQEVVCGGGVFSPDRGCVVMLGVERGTGQLFRVKQFSFQLQVDSAGKKTRKDCERLRKIRAHFRQQLAAVERELSVLARLQHANVLKCVNMTVRDDDSGDDEIIVYLLEEFADGFDLSCHVGESAGRPALAQLHYVSQQLCHALCFLHAKDIVHRDLRCCSALQCGDGGGRLVRLADCGVLARLSELVDKSPELSCRFPGRSYPPSTGRSGKRADIHRLGIVLLALAEGAVARDPQPPLSSLALPPPFVDFLRRCLAKDDHSRWSAEQLLEHAFLKQSPARWCPPANSQRAAEATRSARPLSLAPATNVLEVGCSERLQNEYEILEHVGKGGYGSVVKARNKLDGQLYAIKQVVLDPTRPKECQKIIKEAIVLSRLQHDNVVRYFSAWKGTSTLSAADESNDGTVRTTASCADCPSLSANAAPPSHIASVSSRWNTPPRDFNDLDSTDSSSDSGAWCVAAGGAAATVAAAAAGGGEDSLDSVVFGSGAERKCARSAESEGEQCQSSQPEKSESPQCAVQYLYIQMEFCERKTLRTAIVDGLHTSQQSIWKLFREILEGLYYVHRQGLIHRDLKPDNIFLQDTGASSGRDYRVKLGDFGLAVSKERRAGTDAAAAPVTNGTGASSAAVAIADGALGDRSGQQHHSEAFEFSVAGVGTSYYRAPELCCTTGLRQYTNKVDIYSLGVIFFEMCHCPFATLSERHCVLERLRQSPALLPDDIGRWMSDQQVHLDCWMLRWDPAGRPSAAELLASDRVPAHSREEALFAERLSQTVQRPASARYKRLVEAMFAPRQVRAEDELYDSALWRHLPAPTAAVIVQSTRDRLTALFRRFGAVPLPLPLLAPVVASAAAGAAPSAGQIGSSNSTGATWCHHETLLNSDGALLQLPRALRVALARLVGRTGAAGPDRRYAVETVYSRQRPHGLHPRPRLEALYSVVTPSPQQQLPLSSLASTEPSVTNDAKTGDVCDTLGAMSGALADAELVVVAASLLTALPGLAPPVTSSQPRPHLLSDAAAAGDAGQTMTTAATITNTTAAAAAAVMTDTGCFTLYIGHTQLVEAALTAAHVPADQWHALIADLGQHQRVLTVEQVMSVLSNYSLSERMRGWLATVLCTRTVTLSTVGALFQGRSVASRLCRRALHQLHVVLQLARAQLPPAARCHVVVHLGLVLGPDHWHYNGVVLQLARARTARAQLPLKSTAAAAAAGRSKADRVASSGGGVATEVLAQGGRCDRLLAQFWHLRPRDASAATAPSLSCLTVAFDRCVAAAATASSASASAAGDVGEAACVPYQTVVLGSCADMATTQRQLVVTRLLRDAGVTVFLFFTAAGDSTTVFNLASSSRSSSSPSAAAAAVSLPSCAVLTAFGDEALQWAAAHGARALVLPKPADSEMVLVRPVAGSGAAAAGRGGGGSTAVPITDLLRHLSVLGVEPARAELAVTGDSTSTVSLTSTVTTPAATSAQTSGGGGGGDVTVHWLIGSSSRQAASSRYRGNNSGSGGGAVTSGSSGSAGGHAADRVRFERSVTGRLRAELAALAGRSAATVHVLAVELAARQLEPLTALAVNTDTAADYWLSVDCVLQRYSRTKSKASAATGNIGGAAGVARLDECSERAVTRLCRLIERLRVQRCALVIYGVIDDSRRVLLCGGVGRTGSVK